MFKISYIYIQLVSSRLINFDVRENFHDRVALYLLKSGLDSAFGYVHIRQTVDLREQYIHSHSDPLLKPHLGPRVQRIHEEGGPNSCTTWKYRIYLGCWSCPMTLLYIKLIERGSYLIVGDKRSQLLAILLTQTNHILVSEPRYMQ